jgi:hypothetical protein
MVDGRVSRVRYVIVTEPNRIRSFSSSATGCVTRCPFTRVPFLLPRSSTAASPLADDDPGVATREGGPIEADRTVAVAAHQVRSLGGGGAPVAGPRPARLRPEWVTALGLAQVRWWRISMLAFG